MNGGRRKVGEPVRRTIDGQLAGIVRTVLLLLCLSPIGCVTATMTATSARVPVLLGPVPCIGCLAAPAAKVPAIASVTDAADHRSGYVWVPFLNGDVGFSGDDPPVVGLKVDTLTSDVCKADLRVSRINVRSAGLTALIAARTVQSVELDGDLLLVPDGTCGPRPWPYSGPRGIVFFDAAGGGSP
jgi:hypothetical protein